MTSSRNNGGPRQVPPPPGSRAGASAYSRFIPREELQGFANWTPGNFGGGGAPGAAAQPSAPEPPAPTAEEIEAAWQAQIHDAHQAGYQDGYRDGLVALDSFKQSFAQQTTAQIGSLLDNLQAEFDELEQQMAASLARVAAQLARQVVRSEVAAHPELVARVAAEAVNAVLMSARHITLWVNPQDQAAVAEGAQEALAARGARLLPDASIARGGCKVASDVGTIDARIEARWAQVMAAYGSSEPWQDAAPEAP